MRRVMLIGLDCVPPALAFERYADVMPCLSALREQGSWAKLRSTTPPITVPAWTAMVSGRDPGELGLYGFRKRPRGAYALDMVDSRDVAVERVWDVLARHDLRSSLLFVPPSYPPFRIHGELVSCFLTPHEADAISFPARLSGELAARFGPYVPDVDVRAPRAALFESLCAMTEQHFAMARYVWQTKSPDFLMLVEIGPDRLHHAFYTEIDPTHPRFDREAEQEGLARRYYAQLDRELSSLVALADAETSVIVASDHGARPMRGCFLINEWLIQEGLLCLREPAARPTALSPDMVDWSRTQAWAEGGYYARVFLNVKGREPEGVVAPEAVEALRERLSAALGSVRGPSGETLCNRIERPEQIYRAVRGEAPDLLAFFGGLDVRALSTVGAETLYTQRDERGGDAANHDALGIFVLSGAGVECRGELSECVIQDVGVSVLKLLGIEPPAGWLGVDRTRRS